MDYGKSTLVVSSLTLMSLLKLPGVAKKTLSPALTKNEQIKLYTCSLAMGFSSCKKKAFGHCRLRQRSFKSPAQPFCHTFEDLGKVCHSCHQLLCDSDLFKFVCQKIYIPFISLR